MSRPWRAPRRTGYGPCPLRPYAADHDWRPTPPGRRPGWRCGCGTSHPDPGSDHQPDSTGTGGDRPQQHDEHRQQDEATTGTT